MSNTYDYKIVDMLRDAAGVVKAVTFTITAFDGEDSFTHNFFTGLPAPEEAFIPYEELTEEIVVGWVKQLIGVESEEAADAELTAYKINKNEAKQNGVPWAT